MYICYGQNAEMLIKELLPDSRSGAAVELQVYFSRKIGRIYVEQCDWCVLLIAESFGNGTRIDYGTGHEFKFCAFLCCLMKLEVLGPDCAAQLALKVFSK